MKAHIRRVRLRRHRWSGPEEYVLMWKCKLTFFTACGPRYAIGYGDTPQAALEYMAKSSAYYRAVYNKQGVPGVEPKWRPRQW